MKKLFLSPFMFILLLLIASGGAYALYTATQQEPVQNFSATINRDCAPWDGSAFTINIPMQDGASISISIWQSPEIDHAVTYSFPDDSGQVGNASLMPSEGMPIQLSGEIHFQSVDPSAPVQGQFDLHAENGQQFKGTFNAEWQDRMMLCG